jgi:hypothetical protein
LAGGAAAISPPAISAAPRLAMKAAIPRGNVILNAVIASPLDYCGSIIASRRGLFVGGYAAGTQLRRNHANHANAHQRMFEQVKLQIAGGSGPDLRCCSPRNTFPFNV